MMKGSAQVQKYIEIKMKAWGEQHLKQAPYCKGKWKYFFTTESKELFMISKTFWHLCSTVEILQPNRLCVYKLFYDSLFSIVLFCSWSNCLSIVYIIISKKLIFNFAFLLPASFHPFCSSVAFPPHQAPRLCMTVCAQTKKSRNKVLQYFVFWGHPTLHEVSHSWWWEKGR